MPSGGKYSFTFSKEGTFEYICSIHTFMKGKIVVTK
ncbi:MAG: plastocyanin/azurin family copper-binding protein [Actinobacteria bacterium]|nr:plastocyanin/azurin family copper-binding protein [Actinomycetota bacterium]